MSTIGDKTLVAWVYLDNTTQRGGSALTLDDQASHFDGIIFGERAPATTHLARIVEATDAHNCHAGAWVQGNVYTLPLANLDPHRVYQIRLTASPSNDSFGDVYFRKAK
jgi:hypothetical protein